MTDNHPIVRIENLSRRFGAKDALKNVSLAVQPGQVFGIVGENGAGKTTLIKHILGQYQAQHGSVRAFGMDPVRDPASVLARIGYLSEEPDMPAWMRVEELMRYLAAFYPCWDHDYAAQLLGMFAIDTRRRVRELSKGMRAQVGLVAAQAHRPELLLLDEPSSGLDPNVRRDILTAIIRTVVDEGRTVIFSSHLLDEVERVSDHLLMLRAGEVLLCDPLEHVLENHRRLSLCGDTSARIEHPGIVRSERINGDWLVDFYGDVESLRSKIEPLQVQILAERPLSLSDIFEIHSQRGASR